MFKILFLRWAAVKAAALQNHKIYYGRHAAWRQITYGVYSPFFHPKGAFMSHFPLKRWRKLVAALVSVSVTSLAFGGGFQLWEESAAGTGDYHAGGAAEADDASTEFYNPAGMIRLARPQISTGVAYIPLRVKFDGTIQQQLSGFKLPAQSTNGYQNGDTDNFVPNFHFVYPVNDKFAFGFGVTAPFGLKTEYPNVAPVDLAATLTNLETININPNIAFAVTDKLSFGLGVDYLYGKAQYNQAFVTSSNYIDNSLTDFATGWNTGALYQFDPSTRIGFSYRSKIVFNGNGTSSSNVNNTTNPNLTATLNLPATYLLSFYSDVSKKWALLASVYYTQWDVFKELSLNNVVFFNQINDNFNYRNSWNLVLGTHYNVTEKWMLKGAVAWDETPTQDGYRDIRLPDTNRYVLALGVHWQISKRTGWDLGAAHFFTPNASVNNTSSFPSTGNAVYDVGTAVNNTNVIGTQLTVDL